MSEELKTLYFTRGIGIKHGDIVYPEGDLIELTDAEAAPLRRWLEPSKVVDWSPGSKEPSETDVVARIESTVDTSISTNPATGGDSASGAAPGEVPKDQGHKVATKAETKDNGSGSETATKRKGTQQ